MLSLVGGFGVLTISLLFVGHLPGNDPLHSYQYVAAGKGSMHASCTFK